MTSTITLYKDSKIIPSRNFVVEGIETYLAGLTKVSITDFQYLRNDLNLSIKINKSQIWTDSNNLYNYNYLKVSQNSINYYYFILKKTQVAESTIVLDLLMDTLNTYPWGTAFTPSNRTKVNREHKDRLLFRLETVNFRLNSAFNRLITLTSGDSFTGKLVLKVNGTTEEIDSIFTYRFIVPANYSFIFDFVNEEDQIRFYKLRDSSSVQLISFYDEDNPSGIVEGIDLYFDNQYKIDSISQKRKIDYYSEGITPLLYKTELGRLTHKENSTWNLVYHNDTDQAINCHIIPSDEGLSGKQISTGTLTYTDFEDGAYYLIAPWSISGEIQNITLTDNNSKKYKVKRKSTFDWVCKQIYRTGTTLKIRAIHYSGLTPPVVYDWITITSISFDVSALYYYKGTTPNSTTQNIPASNGSFSTTYTLVDLDSLDDVDRVDPELIKIIEIPYFPSSYTYKALDNSIEVDSTWTYSTSVYKGYRLNDLNTKFLSVIVSDIVNPLNIFGFDSVIEPDGTEARNDYFESKLYHSDYYRPVFVYDSFAFDFELEKIDVANFEPSYYFTFEFIMTSTINSKFLFRFPEYILKMSTQNFDNILSVSRNNEAPIYNSAYITYLRTAYRYDLKAIEYKGIERATNWGANLANIGLDAAITGATGGAGMIGLARSFIGYVRNVVSTASSTNLEYNSLQSKIESLKNQANSVSGSDDLDLLNAYSGNRAKLVLYKLSERDYKLMADIFYYYGYNTEEIKIPDIKTRYWFNFVSCELEFTGLDKNITEVCKENLIQRYNDGATFLHEHSGVWDFAQEKENWESSIL